MNTSYSCVCNTGDIIDVCLDLVSCLLIYKVNGSIIGNDQHCVKRDSAYRLCIAFGSRYDRVSVEIISLAV